MPIYEYECQDCEARFEALVFGTERPACPTCGGDDLDKLFSAFAVGREGPAAAPPGCGAPRGGG